ncbi:sulfotransferase family 2 domain-containing protein [Parasedimentitalea psychrophila]|uniref:Sulfotransferase family 2 domain-containing protein n=1 Tax=Parasedimentitalea psychrophila TaxID=2997337 RepID=A0A9Y2KW67_9RHOB|nr:sulfotransferase family 2 domain-containing protein [Parasedimentitalea psychrophila]WIY23425.1 sulfotransferase family 2 domain-containing protein [Parasedimentitalea psychrophila]
MPISLSKNFLFVHIPKTAGSTVHAALRPYCVSRNRTLLRRAVSWLPVKENPEKAYIRGHSTSAVFKSKLDPALFQRLHKFAIVRNPYDHAVSSYVFTQSNTHGRRHRDAQSWSFSDFLSYLEKKDRILPRNQTTWLVNRAGDLQVDRLLFQEELDNGFAQLCGFLNIPHEGALPRVNATKRKDYRTYYSADSKRRVEALYARDFDLFGYDFEVGKPVRNPLA